MMFLLLIYDRESDDDPVLFGFEDDQEAFKELESQTLAKLDSPGVEVVLFYAESEKIVRSANPRFFNPMATRRLGEDHSVLWAGIEQLRENLGGAAPFFAI